MATKNCRFAQKCERTYSIHKIKAHNLPKPIVAFILRTKHVKRPKKIIEYSNCDYANRICKLRWNKCFELNAKKKKKKRQATNKKIYKLRI